ncbi:MAG: hypothetical protein ISR91_02275, partial [Candidatus Delongbacteria bacterium]|nr:hypothetical protein [Candidatus Delongbacteria bacterium]
MKKFILLSVLLAVNGTLLANNWEGTVNHFWGTAANWSDGTVPTAGDQAYIPPGTPNDCWVSWQDQECNILTIASGASLRIYDQVLTINSYIVTQGHLVMDHNAGELRVAGSFYWYSGSSAAITAGSSEIYVGGDWYFNSGCTAQLANGYVEFNGTGSSSIYSRSPDAGFHHLRCNKQGGTLVVNPTSTADLQVGGNLYYYTGSTFSYNSNYALIMGGSLNNQGGDAYLIAGELVYNGGSHTLQLDGDNYLYHLRLDATGTTQLQSPLDIRGNLNIDNGLLMAAGYDIEIAGNWNDNVGNGFVAGGNQVTFSGNVNNHLSSEEFHDLLVDKSGGTLTIDIGATLDVTGVVTLDQGTVHLSNSCQLQSAGQLSIAAGATLDAAGSWGVALAVGGNWLDENTLAPGFTAGTSTVTFFGSDQWQYISSPDLSSYTFHNLIIDKDFGCVINSSDDFLFTGDFEVITGCWSSPYYTAGVEHTFRGDLSIAADGGFIDENLLRFDTSSDQQLLKEAGASCTIGTIQVDKPTGTLQLAAEILNIWRLEVDQGSCNLNGARLWVDYHVIVNSGGILQLDA